MRVWHSHNLYLATTSTSSQDNMSVQNTPVGISVHDFLTRIIPGAVLIAPAVLSLSISQPALFGDTSFVMLIIGLGSFIAGEIIEIMRSAAFRTPLPFLHLIYRETDNEEKLSWTQQKLLGLEREVSSHIPDRRETSKSNYLESRLQLDLRDSMEQELGIDFDSSSPRDIYDFLILRLEPELSIQTKRYRSLTAFTSNLRIASVLALLCYGLFFLVDREDPWITFALGVSVILFGYIWPISQVFSNASNLYVEALLKEYYSHITRNESSSKTTNKTGAEP